MKELRNRKVDEQARGQKSSTSLKMCQETETNVNEGGGSQGADVRRD